MVSFLYNSFIIDKSIPLLVAKEMIAIKQKYRKLNMTQFIIFFIFPIFFDKIVKMNAAVVVKMIKK